jgi:1-deoxy-D-xylulose-5-phosphate synthase
MIKTQYGIDTRPSVVRFPRGSGYGEEQLRDILSETSGLEETMSAYENGVLDPNKSSPVEIGKGRMIKSGAGGRRYKVALLSIGTRLVETVLAARTLEEQYPDVSVTVADARFMKPLDEGLIDNLAKSHDIMLTLEEGSKGGFGAHVLHHMTDAGLLDTGLLKVRAMYIPDIWIEAGPMKDQYDIAGLNAEHIVAKVHGLVQGMRDYR